MRIGILVRLTQRSCDGISVRINNDQETILHYGGYQRMDSQELRRRYSLVPPSDAPAHPTVEDTENWPMKSVVTFSGNTRPNVYLPFE